MTLTKEDFEVLRKAIKDDVEDVIEAKVRPMIDEQLKVFDEEKLGPIREAVKKLLTAQIEIVEKVDNLGNRLSIVMHHLGLSPTSRDLKQTLRALD